MKALVCVVLVGACSFATTRVPHSVKPGDPPLECNPGPRNIDTVMTLVGFGLAIGLAFHAADAPQGESGPDMLAATFGIPSAVAGAIYFGSAIYGANAIRRCRRLQSEAATTPSR